MLNGRSVQVKKQSLEDCVSMCMGKNRQETTGEQICKSVNYISGKSECRLNFVDEHTTPEKLVNGEGSYYCIVGM